VKKAQKGDDKAFLKLIQQEKVKLYRMAFMYVKEDKTLLYFQVESDFPYDGHFNLNALWIEDAAGNELTGDAKGYPDRIAPNTYVQEFQRISESEPLTVVTREMLRIEVAEELQVKIPIPKN